MKTTLIAAAAGGLLFAAGAAAQPGAGGGMPANEVIFERNDTNKDGRITESEAQAAETQLGANFSMFDLDSDGNVTAEELDTMRSRMPGGGGGAGGPGGASGGPGGGAAGSGAGGAGGGAAGGGGGASGGAQGDDAGRDTEG